MTVESLKTRSDLTVDEFEQLMNEERDIKVYKKLNFLKLKAEGNSTKKAYKFANLKKSLAYRTLDQWNEGGYNALLSQFNIDLNENKDSIKDLTTKLQKHLKELENSDVENDDEINRIKFLISREQNAEVLKKLIYLLFRSLNFSNRFSSSLLSITTATGNNWLNRWEKIGYEGLKRKKGQGRKCKLTNNQIETLKKTK